ncbi:MAG TPA: response regulator transcription factor [Anaerolineae bacterium]|nr:response regulator transcription factor [Anaerolineae bacterium]MCB0181797.1 response regulator transcription factor [Anaerolineae bacterium]MCB0223365.1 response regulator transcription factor [Anaerolineae bacterium]MCB9106903.1 response regulator transcription factor [Anaerolineales bacterium]HRV94181.1 response regulator transcription factor [Anaerolineae bacterium]
MTNTTVMLVDDHPLFRQGLRRVLEAQEGIEVIMEVADGEEALRLAKQLSPDVVLMDINLPKMNGLQVTRELKQAAPEIAVIMLTAYHDDEQIFHAVRAGAAAYFPKDVTPRRLVEAIRQVGKGNYVIDDEVLDKPEVASWLLSQFDKVAYVDGLPNEMFAPLSPREMEILQHIAKGQSNKEVAYELGISRQTVKNHMTSILRKLAVNDRTQAALYAVRRGWIRLHDEEQ